MVSQMPAQMRSAASISLVPAKAGTQNLHDGLDSQHKRVDARLDALCAGMSGEEGVVVFSFRWNNQKSVSRLPRPRRAGPWAGHAAPRRNQRATAVPPGGAVQASR